LIIDVLDRTNIVRVSPADGKLLHIGTIKGLRVEQVKGLTYSLDIHNLPENPTFTDGIEQRNMEIVTHSEFVDVNGIDYSLDQLLGLSPSCSLGSTTLTLTRHSPYRSDAIILLRTLAQAEPGENFGTRWDLGFYLPLWTPRNFDSKAEYSV
jgi:phosphatidylserine decarboxylase